MRARDALRADDAPLALRWLGDGRLQQIPLDRKAQIELGMMKSDIYAAMRSYLASARERIYVHSLLAATDRAGNGEAIFNTLRELSAGVLRRQAEREITPEVRGWLSLAELAQRHADDPQRTLLEFDNWRIAWSNHPAAQRPPRSLLMLRDVVTRQPRRVALLLPLHGSLAPYGRAIRDGIVGAHYHATAGQQTPPELAVYDTSAADLASVLSEARSDGAELIIHNALFDIGFLDTELALAKKKKLSTFCPNVIDTLRMAKDLHPGKRNGLDALCERYQVDNSERTLHGALLDAELLADVYLAMTRGQDSLIVEAETVQADTGERGFDRSKLKLAVVCATAEELAAHEEIGRAHV